MWRLSPLRRCIQSPNHTFSPPLFPTATFIPLFFFFPTPVLLFISPPLLSQPACFPSFLSLLLLPSPFSYLALEILSQIQFKGERRAFQWAKISLRQHILPPAPQGFLHACRRPCVLYVYFLFSDFVCFSAGGNNCAHARMNLAPTGSQLELPAVAAGPRLHTIVDRRHEVDVRRRLSQVSSRGVGYQLYGAVNAIERKQRRV